VRGHNRPVFCDVARPFADMCSRCRLATPSGLNEVCHACAVALRSEVRRGLNAIEKYLDGWSEFDRWRSDEE
jgi:hypothetical protein